MVYIFCSPRFRFFDAVVVDVLDCPAVEVPERFGHVELNVCFVYRLGKRGLHSFTSIIYITYYNGCIYRFSMKFEGFFCRLKTMLCCATFDYLSGGFLISTISLSTSSPVILPCCCLGNGIVPFISACLNSHARRQNGHFGSLCVDNHLKNSYIIVVVVVPKEVLSIYMPVTKLVNKTGVLVDALKVEGVRACTPDNGAIISWKFGFRRTCIE